MIRLLLIAVLVVTPVPALADMGSALEAVRSETQVHGADWRHHRLLVLMRDDGSRRDGFAEYLCMVVAEHNVQPPPGQFVSVRVWDAANPEAERELGMAVCPK